MRVLFDTNVLISAFLSEGVCAKLLIRSRRREFDLFVCSFVLDELKEKLATKLTASRSEIDETASLLLEDATMVELRRNTGRSAERAGIR